MSGLLFLILNLLIIAGMWKIFEKAGYPGWGALIPIYNTYLLVKVAGKPGWWVILLFVPLVNIVIALLVMMEIAQRFGKEKMFGLGLFLLPFVFFPMLGFGSAEYQPSGEAESLN